MSDETTQTRAHELLETFFDESISVEEAEELLDAWERAPGMRQPVCDNLYMEGVFRFSRDLRRSLTPDRLEELKNAFWRHAEHSGIELSGIEAATEKEEESETDEILLSESGDRLSAFPDLDVLARLASLSPSLPKLETAELPELRPLSPKAGAKRTNVSKKPERFTWPLIVTILVLFTLAIYHEFQHTSSSSGPKFVALGEITESVDAVWEKGGDYKKGRELGVEKLSLLSGVVQLRLKNNVEVVLEGPTEFVLRGNDETFCRAGKISVTVPPEGKGFKVATPVATVVDLGTAFSLSADEEKIDVHVIKGVVDVARSGSNKFQLTTGLAAMLDFQGATRHFPSDHSTFFSNQAVRELWDGYVQRRRPVWEAEKRRRSDDPGLLISLDDAKVYGCREVEGSRPDLMAFRFQSRHDCLDVSMSGAHSDLTLVADVRIRNMDNFSNTLCLGSGFLVNDGEFAWQLDRDGILRFQIQSGSVQRYDSGVVVARGDWNTWMQFAVVADANGREIRYYRDGRRVAAMPWTKPLPLRMPEGAIGNAPPEQRKRSARFWGGDINAFYAFSRAFSDREIAEMYENGR